MKMSLKSLIKGSLAIAGFSFMLSTSALTGKAREYSSEVGTISGLGGIKDLAGKEVYEAPRLTYYTGANNNVKKIVFVTNADLSLYKDLPSSSGYYGVNSYYDKNSATGYVCTRASKIIFDYPEGDFSDFRALEEIDFTRANVGFSKYANSTKDMFKNCTKLKYVDLSSFDASNITDMTSMFEGCESLKSIKLGNFKTANVSSFSRMFYDCESLDNLTLRSFDTSGSYTMNEMFKNCRSLRKLDLSSFDTSAVLTMGGMFDNCHNLKSLELGNFDTTAVVNMRMMFHNCDSLEALNLASFDTGSTTDMFGMFYGCRSLKSLNISSFSLTNNVKSEYMLEHCVALNTIDAPCKTPMEIDLAGEYYLDNNRDGSPDSEIKYRKIPISSSSNRFISVSSVNAGNNQTVNAAGVTRVNAGGVEYDVYPDGRVVATKIGAVKNVTIDKVEVNGAARPVTEVASNACKGNKTVKSLKIGQGVTSIGSSAFSGCKNLKKVTISANAKLKIGSGAFKKINKKAAIKVSGIKGKARKKLIKQLKKNANANVK